MKGFFMKAINDDLYADMTYNELLNLVKSQINVLLDWASEDFEMSLDFEAKSDARNDKQRVRNLQRVLDLIKDSYK